MTVKATQIGDCVRIVNGFAFRSDHFNSVGKGLPVARIRDVVRGHSETFFAGDYPAEMLIKNGDLLAGMDGEFNTAFWRGGHALLNQRVCKIVPREGIADISYLRHALQIVLKRIEDRTPFVTVKHLSSEDLKQESISLPEITEQCEIAERLNTAERLVHMRRHALRICDELLPAIFLEMFGDPIANTAGWNVHVTSEIAEVQGGLQQIARRERLPLKRPFLRVANVQRGELDLTDVRLIGLTQDEFQRTILKRDDLLLVEGNGNPAEVGRAALWTGAVRDCVHQNHLIRVRCDPSAILPIFMLHLLNSRRGMDYYLKRGRTTSGLVTISTGLVNEFPCLVPPLSLQCKFAGIAHQQRQLRELHLEAVRQADHLFQTLLHQTFAAQHTN